MRLAILSDIHANLPALEAVLADIEGAGVDEIWCLGDVVGYGAQPDECAALVARALRAVPGRQPRPRRARRARDLDLLPRRRRRRRVDARATSTDATLDFLRGLEPADESREVAPLPRLAARPGLGVRALARPGGGVHRGPGGAGQPDRPLPRGAVLRVDAEPTTASPRPRGAQAEAGTEPRARRGPLADQPRQRRPAARRRPARRLARARHRGRGRPPITASTTRSTAPPRRSSRPAFRSTSRAPVRGPMMPVVDARGAESPSLDSPRCRDCGSVPRSRASSRSRSPGAGRATTGTIPPGRADEMTASSTRPQARSRRATASVVQAPRRTSSDQRQRRCRRRSTPTSARRSSRRRQPGRAGGGPDQCQSRRDRRDRARRRPRPTTTTESTDRDDEHEPTTTDNDDGADEQEPASPPPERQARRRSARAASHRRPGAAPAADTGGTGGVGVSPGEGPRR